MNWYVLFVLSGQEDSLINFIKDDKVTAFKATLEYWRSSEKRIDTKSLFPGYVFCKCNLNQIEFDEWLNNKPMKKGMIKELRHGDTTALLPEEINLFEKLFNDQGVIVMSKGVRVNGKFHVLSGPLKDMDDYIIKYRNQNKLATLDRYLLEKRFQAGIMDVSIPDNSNN